MLDKKVYEIGSGHKLSKANKVNSNQKSDKNIYKLDNNHKLNKENNANSK